MSGLWRHPVRAFATLALVAAIAGCGSNEDGLAPTSDEAELSSLVTAGGDFEDYFELDTSFGEPTGGPEAPGLPISLSPIENLLGWHRERESVTHIVTSTIEGGIAHVTHDATITGQFHIRALEGDERVTYLKPMVNDVERHATFERRTPSRPRGPRWHLVSVSCALVESAVDGNPPTVGIASVTIAPEGEEALVITDPRAEIRREDLLRLSPGTEVTITVVPSGAPAMAFLHSGGRHGVARFRDAIPQLEDGTFQGTWRAPLVPGVYHAAIDLLSETTLLESEAFDGPYDSMVWKLPYRVSVVEE